MPPGTKGRILHTSQRLFNSEGVANTTMRQVAKRCGLSHSNLIYHYSDKGKIVEALHQQLLEKAIAINGELLAQPSMISALVEQTRKGFAVSYDFRFFFRELNWIAREYKALQKTLLDAEPIRKQMYLQAFELGIRLEEMRPFNSDQERDDLIANIRIFSDYWLSSAEIYEKGAKAKIIERHVRLFFGLLSPYLTEQGRQAISW